jgi:arrestin-related trafficking adapter 4/5/7
LILREIRIKTNAKWHRWHEQIHVPHLDSTPGFERIPLEGTTLSAGNYEWPFELVVPGSMAESIEGLDDAHVKYKLKATVTRGQLFHNLHAHKPICIIRTLGPSALAHAASMKNIWPNKVEYSLVVSQWAAVFGTSIQIEMTFTPLLKGLKIKTVKVDLEESHDWSLNFPTYGYQHWKKLQDIALWKFEEEHYQDTTNHLGRDGWVLKEIVLLPRHCIQDVEFEVSEVLTYILEVTLLLSRSLKHYIGC